MAEVVLRSQQLLVGTLANLLINVGIRVCADEAGHPRHSQVVAVAVIAGVVMNRSLIIQPMLVELLLQLRRFIAELLHALVDWQFFDVQLGQLFE